MDGVLFVVGFDDGMGYASYFKVGNMVRLVYPIGDTVWI